MMTVGRIKDIVFAFELFPVFFNVEPPHIAIKLHSCNLTSIFYDSSQ
jgi:hypothetical protein